MSAAIVCANGLKLTAMPIEYRLNAALATVDIIRVFDASGIRRPTAEPARIERMFENANLVLSAWEGDRLIGLARVLTDHVYCAYLSDLAVDRAWQHLGVGRELLLKLREALGPAVTLLLLSSPEAMAYYPHQGFTLADNCYLIKRER